MAKPRKPTPEPNPKIKPDPGIRSHADYEDEISDGQFSDLGGFTDDLDLDINEQPPWASKP